MNDPSVIARADGLRRMLGDYCGMSASKLTPEKKLEIRRLVTAGANLNGIHTLYHFASYYKEGDLFDLLIDEYSMGVNQRDEDGQMPTHVAVSIMNVDAFWILISKGADRSCENSDGKPHLQG